MRFDGIHEKTLLIVKPDGVQRGLVGEILVRLERKGLKIVGLKMMRLDDAILREHYAHIVEKPFYPSVEAFMKSDPVVVICAEGKDAAAAVCLISGVTNAAKADAGTIRGDFAMGMSNVVHRSDSAAAGEVETKRFFSDSEIFEYDKTEYLHVYMDDERG